MPRDVCITPDCTPRFRETRSIAPGLRRSQGPSLFLNVQPPTVCARVASGSLRRRNRLCSDATRPTSRNRGCGLARKLLTVAA